MKTNKMYFLILLSFLMLYIAVSCQSPGTAQDTEDNNKIKLNVNIANMDISDAKTLLIAPGTLLAGNTNEENALFKLNESDEITEVQYKDIDNKEVEPENSPVSIFNINDTYVMISFGANPENITDAFLVRKSDGAVFSLKNAGIPYPQKNSFRNTRHVYADLSGNIYYRAVTNNIAVNGEPVFEVAKLDISDPNSIIKVSMSSPVDNIEYFEIDSTGDVLYYGKSSNDDTIPVRRIITPGKAIINLAYPKDLFWQSADGKLYVPGGTDSYRIDIDGTHVSYDGIGGAMITGSHTQKDYFKLRCQGNDYLFKVGLGAYWSTMGSDGYKVYSSFETLQGNAGGIIDFDLISIRYAMNSDTHIYLSGLDPENRPKLVKIDGNDLSNDIDLYTPGTYDIFQMSVSGNNEVTFNALRFSDSAIVLGKIDASNVLSILDASVNTTIIALERID